jgi:hypothetical protein
VPLSVSRFGFTTEIPAGWRASTHLYADRQRVTLIAPGDATIVIDRTPRAPTLAQVNHGFRTLSVTSWHGRAVSGIRWRFAAPFCHPVCSDWIGASSRAGYAVLIYSPTLATIAATYDQP